MTETEDGILLSDERRKILPAESLALHLTQPGMRCLVVLLLGVKAE